jgi:anti-sigma factor RsiW
MNCFEARQEFTGFWRGVLDADRRAELLAHLKSCAGCDHAFRVFAFTAPVLHSEAEPPSRRAPLPAREFSLTDRPRRFASASRGEARPQRWFAMSAAVTIFAAASLAAYLSVTAPMGSLTDEFSGSEVVSPPEATVDLFNDPTMQMNDFAS